MELYLETAYYAFSALAGGCGAWAAIRHRVARLERDAVDLVEFKEDVYKDRVEVSDRLARIETKLNLILHQVNGHDQR